MSRITRFSTAEHIGVANTEAPDGTPAGVAERGIHLNSCATCSPLSERYKGAATMTDDEANKLGAVYSPEASTGFLSVWPLWLLALIVLGAIVFVLAR